MEKLLIVNNNIIMAEPMEILTKLLIALDNKKIQDIRQKQDTIQIQCPVHAGGHEHRPSCFINVNREQAPYLWAHCFTCGLSCSFVDFIAHCFESTRDYAQRWLLANFEYISSSVADTSESFCMEPIILNSNKTSETKDLSFDRFENFHPYMKKRNLTDEVISRFEIKYDPETKCIVMPVRDKHGKLVFFTRRTTEGKKFIIDKGADKSEVYLLYEAINNGYQDVIIAESQINALVSYGYGKPAVATFGCGCPDKQIQTLNEAPIRHYIIGFDPDQPGNEGAVKLCEKLSTNKFVDVLLIPSGKDIGDLTKDEFDNLQMIDRYDFIAKYKK